MTTRRLFLVGGAALALSACSSTGRRQLTASNPNVIQVDEPWASYYSMKRDEQFPIPGIDIRRIPQQFWRQEVD